MLLYWRLSAFYFFYFASIGSLLPYFGLYLHSHGYEAQQISLVFAVIMGTKIVAPNIWGWIADHTGKRMRTVRIASLLSLLSFSAIFVSQDYYWLLVVMMVFSFFWNATLPQLEAVTLSHLGDNSHKYSTIRLWGSMGFVILVTLLGAIFEIYSVDLLSAIFILLLIGILICSFFVPNQEMKAGEYAPLKLKSILLKPQVMIFFVICFLLQASHGPYYAFYSLYLEQHDYTRSLIGQLWALGVIAEILLFLFMHKLLLRVSVTNLLIVCLVLTASRWLLIAFFADLFLIILLAQCLHAASFGLFHAIAIHQIHRYFPGRLSGRGQALYSSLSFGAGGAFGAFYSGWIWSELGASWSYIVAAAVATLAAFCAFYYRRLLISA